MNAGTLTQNPLLGGDFYTQNFRDPGLHYVLPGTTGTVGTYFVRVRSNPQTTPITSLSGQRAGKYQLQVRLQQVDEFPGSTVQYADIRFAQTGIDVRGLPNRSPLVGEAGELPTDNNTFATAQTAGQFARNRYGGDQPVGIALRRHRRRLLPVQSGAFRRAGDRRRQ